MGGLGGKDSGAVCSYTGMVPDVFSAFLMVSGAHWSN
jgi:hypothetical protein